MAAPHLRPASCCCRSNHRHKRRRGCIESASFTPPRSQVLARDDLAFSEELRRRGYVEGQNLVVERRDAENPSDMAIEQPTKIDLVINLKTARTLGVTISQSLRVQAELIE